MDYLEEYLGYIGCADIERSASLEMLDTIIRGHLDTIPFSNVLPYIERRKPCDERQVQSVAFKDAFDLLITNKQPGYCYLHAEILHEMLSQLGFEVERHVAKVIKQNEAEYQSDEIAERTPTHEMLFVVINGSHYLIDTGFSNNSLRGFYNVSSAAEQTVNTDQYRLIPIGENKNTEYRLDVLLDRGWFCLYQFDLHARTQEEVHQLNADLFLAPEFNPIGDAFLVFAQVKEARQLVIRYTDTPETIRFKRSQCGEVTERRKITEAQQLNELAKNFKFDIRAIFSLPEPALTCVAESLPFFNAQQQPDVGATASQVSTRPATTA